MKAIFFVVVMILFAIAAGARGQEPLQVQSAQAQHFTPQENREVGKSIARIYFGWEGRQWRALDRLFNRESRWDEHAHNRRSGAHGIPQALPGRKMARYGADWSTNPVTQITWGLHYIKGRYGNPVRALAHSDRYGWY